VTESSVTVLAALHQALLQHPEQGEDDAQREDDPQADDDGVHDQAMPSATSRIFVMRTA
jgi:hypothetical protein